jgi:hypothetical protein
MYELLHHPIQAHDCTLVHAVKLHVQAAVSKRWAANQGKSLQFVRYDMYQLRQALCLFGSQSCSYVKLLYVCQDQKSLWPGGYTSWFRKKSYSTSDAKKRGNRGQRTQPITLQQANTATRQQQHVTLNTSTRTSTRQHVNMWIMCNTSASADQHITRQHVNALAHQHNHHHSDDIVQMCWWHCVDDWCDVDDRCWCTRFITSWKSLTLRYSSLTAFNWG